MLGRISICMLLLLIGMPAQAEDAETKQVDPVKEAKDLHKLAYKQQDLWTCLQLEHWAEQQEERVRFSTSALGRTTDIYGNAVWAFPHSVRSHWDLGDKVGILSQAQFRWLAADGRPLRPSFKMPFYPDRYRLEAGGRYLAIARMDGPSNKKVVSLAIVDLVEEDTVLQGKHKLPPAPNPEAHWDTMGSVACAADGSAIALSMNRHKTNYPHMLIAVANPKDKDNVQVQDQKNIWDPQVVGPKANWICGRITNVKAWRNLLKDGKLVRSLPDDIHSHSGITMFRDKDNFHIIRRDGSVTEWKPAVSIGPHWRWDRYGSWLVIHSGEVDAVADSGDFTAPAETVKARYHYLFSWEDLADEQSTTPAHVYPSKALTRADAEATACLGWTDDQLILHDLSGAKPEHRPIGNKMPGNIRWASSKHHMYLVELTDGRKVILDGQGRERWIGKADHLFVQSRGYALRRQGADGQFTFTAVHLSLEPDKRKEVELQLVPGAWRVQIDGYRHRCVAQLGNSWKLLDAETGKITKSYDFMPGGDPPERAPGVRREPAPRGRFYRPGNNHARLLRKDHDENSLPADHRWHLSDALPLARKMGILDTSGRFYLVDRNKIEEIFQDRRLRRFKVADKGSGLYFASERGNEILGVLAPGMKVKAIEKAPKTTWPDDWGWRLKGSRGGLGFTIPGKGRELAWRTEDLGFYPKLAHGVSRRHLLLVTESLAMVIDTSTAVKLASPKQK